MKWPFVKRARFEKLRAESEELAVMLKATQAGFLEHEETIRAMALVGFYFPCQVIFIDAESRYPIKIKKYRSNKPESPGKSFKIKMGKREYIDCFDETDARKAVNKAFRGKIWK